MDIGKVNKLEIGRRNQNGFYLKDKEGNEVLLPINKNIEKLDIGTELDVFIYKDSEDRLVASTVMPKVELEHFAYLRVNQVNRFGAFLDWGLPKDLMVPFAEQNRKLNEGDWTIVFVLLDEETDRLVGSCRVNDFVFTDDIGLKPGEEVDVLPYHQTELGMNVIVNNMFKGLIFESDIHKTIKKGLCIKGYVKKVRSDGKIDIVLEPSGYQKSIDRVAEKILNDDKNNKGTLPLNDKSSPEEIKKLLGLSKKAFKRGVGSLYKQRIIELTKQGIKLIK